MNAFHFVSTATDRTRQVAIASLVWSGIAAGSILLFFFNPTSAGFFPTCPFRALTGLQCPGCGSTRACYQLIHLHPVAAFKLNPLMMLTLPHVQSAKTATSSYLPARSLAPQCVRNQLCLDEQLLYLNQQSNAESHQNAGQISRTGLHR